jgi:hypothetical protein
MITTTTTRTAKTEAKSGTKQKKKRLHDQQLPENWS